MKRIAWMLSRLLGQQDLEEDFINVRMRRLLEQDAPIGPRFPTGLFTVHDVTTRRQK